MEVHWHYRVAENGKFGELITNKPKPKLCQCGAKLKRIGYEFWSELPLYSCVLCKLEYEADQALTKVMTL